MASNWKAALRMTLENAGVLNGLRAHERAASGADKATGKAAQSLGKFVSAGSGLEGMASRLRNVEGAAGNAGAALGRAGGGVGQWADLAGKAGIAQMAIQAVGGVADKVGAIFKEGMNLENLTRQLAASTEDTESLRSQMDELAKVAAKPGIDFQTALQGSAALQSVGMSAKDSRNALEQWSNVVASAGGNAETLKGVLMAVRQIMTKDGGVQQEDVNQILERVPQFATINAGLEKLKSNPKEYIAAATKELGKLSRVAEGAQEATDGMADAWVSAQASFARKYGIMALGNAAQTLGAGVLGLDAKKIMQTDDAFRSGLMDPVETLQPDASEIARRQEARDAAAKQRIEEKTAAAEKYFALAKENAKKLFDQQDAELRLEVDIAKAEAAGDVAQKQALQDQLEILTKVKKMTADLNTEEDQVTMNLQTQQELRREAAAVAGRKSAETATEAARVQALRNAGRNKEADRAEEKQTQRDRLKSLRDQKVPEDVAKKLVDDEARNRRDQKSIDRTGRRRITGAKARGYQGLDDFKFVPDGAVDGPRPTLGLEGVPSMLDSNPKGGIGKLPTSQGGPVSTNGRRADRMAGLQAGQAREAQAAASSESGGIGAMFATQLKRQGKVLEEIERNTRKGDRATQR